MEEEDAYLIGNKKKSKEKAKKKNLLGKLLKQKRKDGAVDMESSESRKPYRLLLMEDIDKSIKDLQIELLWPDDGTWYPVEVTNYDAKNHIASMLYPLTGEAEDVELEEV